MPLALEGTVTLSELQPPIFRFAIGCQFPVHVQLPVASCRTYGWTLLMVLPAGIQKWYRIFLPGATGGDGTKTSCVSAPLAETGIASERVPLHTWISDCDGLPSMPPLVVQPCMDVSKLYSAVSTAVARGCPT